MNAAEWEKVSSLLDQALELTEAERTPFLERLRRDDPSLCAEVESLLANEHHGAHFETPPTVNLGDTATSAATSTAPDLPKQLGGYRIEKVLGSGGMGVVYQAEDIALHRSIAIKVMKPEHALHAEARQRFLREARAAAKVEHDNIIPIYQVGEDRRVPFVAMPLLKGMSLEDLLRRTSPLQLKQTLRVGIQIAEGLNAAHEKDLIHRDIKPGNVWIEPTAGGRVRILDFGLARPIAGDAGITQSGTILGTPAYMPPEQARGDKVDHRADLYSLGCILYRMTTGEMPIKGNDTMAVLMALATKDPVAPAVIKPEVPKALSDLIMRLLAKDPVQRIGSAKEVAQALKAIERGGGTPVNEPTAILSASMLVSPADLPMAKVLQSGETTSPFAFSKEAARDPSGAAHPIPACAPPKRRRPAALIAVAVCLASTIALLAGGIFYVATDNGTLEIKTDDKSVKVIAEENGGKVTIIDPASKQTWVLNTGKYTLKLDGNAAGLEIKLPEKQAFQMKRGDKVVVSIRKIPGVIAKGEPNRDPTITPLEPAWIKEVAAMSAAKQAKAVADKLKERNPGFDGTVDHKAADGVVFEFNIHAGKITDISPVQALSGLRTLRCAGHQYDYSKLADLTPLKGLKLNHFECQYTGVADLTPLKGMPLTHLECWQTNVADLTPLKGIKLVHLNFTSTKVDDLEPLKGMPLEFLACGSSKINDLSPLKGITSLKVLDCSWSGVSDLSAVKGMPLTSLCFMKTPVADLTPLKGMPLKNLLFVNAAVTDLSVLRGMSLENIDYDLNLARDGDILRSIKTLATISGKPAAEVLKAVAAAPTLPPLDPAWLKEVAGMSTAKQVKAVIAKLKERNPKLKERNPGFDGNVLPQVDGGAVVGLEMKTYMVTDISPLRALTGLKKLRFVDNNHQPGSLADLTPLKGMNLTSLECGWTAVSDLSPLAGMPLTYLNCEVCKVEDVSPLKGMPLTKLKCSNNGKINDLEPLQGMPLAYLECAGTAIVDLSPLKGMPLRQLNVNRTRVNDLTPLKGMKLTHLTFNSNAIQDLAPLEGMPLTQLEFSGVPVSNLAPLKGMPLTLLEMYATSVSDLSPLKNMPLTTLNFEDTKVTDIAPLRGMALTSIRCNQGVSDLSPLKDAPLKEIRCSFKRERDAAILRSVKTLERINSKNAAEFWKEVDSKKISVLPPLDPAWVKAVAAMQPEAQLKAVSERLMELNPGFDGKISPEIDKGTVVRVSFDSSHAADKLLTNPLNPVHLNHGD